MKSKKTSHIIKEILLQKQSDCPHPFNKVEEITAEDVPEKPHMAGSYCSLCGKKLTEDDL